MHNRLTLLFRDLLLVAVIGCNVPAGIAEETTTSGEASELIASAEPLIENFFTAEHWAAVRNLTGVARAILIMPSGGQAGLLVGAQWGRGFLFVRHGQQWSDPVFIRIGSLQIGFLVGGQKVGLAGAVLSEAALERVLDGSVRVSGSGDFTVGIGVSGRAAGGPSGGIEMLTVSSNKGFYIGGSFEGLKIWIDEDMNRSAYGDTFDVSTIIQRPGGNYEPAIAIRSMLEKSAYQAVWGDD